MQTAPANNLIAHKFCEVEASALRMRPSEPYSIRSVSVRSRKDEAFVTFPFNDKRLETLMVWTIEMFGPT